MRINLLKTLLLLLLFGTWRPAHSQIMYQSRYKSAILIEGSGISPYFSMNWEMAPVRLQKSFYTFRVGAGFIPGNSKTGLVSGFSLPTAITYNIMLPQIIKDKLKLLNTFPRRFRFESFIETGMGYTWVNFKEVGKKDRNTLYGLLGFRFQVHVNIPPKPKVIFVKVGLNPKIPTTDINTFFSSNSLSTNILNYSLGYSF